MGSFRLEAVSGEARAGVLVTPHGPVPTPAFLPVASQASVKTITSAEAQQVGTRILLANTYHLYLRPGVDVVQRLGGLHAFMGWNGPILTDSGGFQAFSLGSLRKVSDEGILFRSHIDGSQHLFTPEGVIQYQEALGADLIMVLDECVAANALRQEVETALQRTHQWALRCRDVHRRVDQWLLGIVQGGLYTELRETSARYITSLDFPGYAIGGLGVGEPKEEMYHMAGFTARLLPAEKPRYLMGVGSPDDLVACVAVGIDLFDCALPTRVARTGALFTRRGRVDILSARYREERGPVDPTCDCPTCQDYSAAYLHHLFRAKELLGLRLATLHNLRFVLRLMEEMRQAIVSGRFQEWQAAFTAIYVPTNEERRLAQKARWLERRRSEETNW